MEEREGERKSEARQKQDVGVSQNNASLSVSVTLYLLVERVRATSNKVAIIVNTRSANLISDEAAREIERGQLPPPKHDSGDAVARAVIRSRKRQI